STDKRRQIDASIKRGQRLYAGIGCVACHQLYEDRPGSSAVYPLHNLGSKTTPDQLAAYLADPLAIDPSGHMPSMRLNAEEARDLPHYLCQAKNPALKQELPEPPGRNALLAAFRRVEPRAEEMADFERLPAASQWLDLGKRLVIEKGCNNCHTIAP